MVRYTFGGEVTHLVTYADSTLGGALKANPGAAIPFYTTPTGGSPSTDFMFDPGVDGTYELAGSSVTALDTGYLPPFQGPDNITVLYFDPDPNDADTRRMALFARDIGAGGVSQGSTTQLGVYRTATDAEIDAGTVTDEVVTPAGLQRKLNTHADDPDAHPGYAEPLEQITGALEKFPEMIGTPPKVQVGDLPATEGPSGGQLVLRRPGGQAAGAAAGLDDEFITKLQLSGILDALPSTGTDVRFEEYEAASTAAAVSSASTTAFADIPTVQIIDAESDQWWWCGYDLSVMASALGGIKVQLVSSAATPTNRALNPSFETDVANWNWNAAAGAVARDTAGGGALSSSAYAKMPVSGTAVSAQMWSDWAACNPNDVFSAAAYFKRLSATADRSCRIDIMWGTEAATNTALTSGVLNSDLSQAAVIGGAWAQVKKENVLNTYGAVKVRARATVLQASTGDVYGVDAVQLEPGATVPAYGNTAGGANTLSVRGGWGPGPKLTGAASADDMTRTQRLRYPAVGDMSATFGGIGAATEYWLPGGFLVKIGGTGLRNQRIALQFAQSSADAANPTRVLAAQATFARVA